MSDEAYFPWLDVPRPHRDPTVPAEYRRVNARWRFGTDDEQRRYQFALRDAYGNTVYCTCKEPFQRMAVKAYGDPPTYNVAIHGLTGANHRRGCHFYSNKYAGGNIRKRYHEAITIGNDGIASIRLNMPMRMPSVAADTPPPAPLAARPAAAAANAYATTTMHGALNYLWECAKLNLWRPDGAERSPAAIARRAWKTAVTIRLGDYPLSHILITSPPGLPPENNVRNIRRLFRTAHNAGHALALLAIVPGDGSSLVDRLTAASRDVDVDVVIPDPLIGATARSYVRQIPYAVGQLAVFALGFPADASRTLRLSAIGIAALNDNYIPIDSLYERTIADKLIRERRLFTKPLRAPGADHLPDFVLDDTDRLTELEVFGRTDPDYRERAAAKKARGVWYWDATLQREPPPFPRAS